MNKNNKCGCKNQPREAQRGTILEGVSDKAINMMHDIEGLFESSEVSDDDRRAALVCLAKKYEVL
jgi:hypothetical protein